MKRIVFALLIILSPVAADDTWDGEWTIEDNADSVDDDLITESSGQQVTLIDRSTGQPVDNMSLSFDPEQTAAGGGYVYALEVTDPHGNGTLHAYHMSNGSLKWTWSDSYLPISYDWDQDEEYIRWGDMMVQDGIVHVSQTKAYYYCNSCESAFGETGYEKNYIVKTFDQSGNQIDRAQTEGQDNSFYDVDDPILVKRGESVRLHGPDYRDDSYYLKNGQVWGSTDNPDNRRWVNNELHSFENNGQDRFESGTDVWLRVKTPEGSTRYDFPGDPENYEGDIAHKEGDYVFHFNDSVLGQPDIKVRKVDNWSNVLWKRNESISGQIAISSGRAWIDRRNFDFQQNDPVISYDLETGTRYIHNNTSRFTDMRVFDGRVLLSSQDSLYWWQDGCYTGKESFQSPELVDTRGSILVSHSNQLTQMSYQPESNIGIGAVGIAYDEERLVTNDLQGTEDGSVVVNHSVPVGSDPFCPVSTS